MGSWSPAKRPFRAPEGATPAVFGDREPGSPLAAGGPDRPPAAVNGGRSVRVEIWSDIVCPWCYIGKRRFERALEDFPQAEQVEIAHRAFQLNPSMPPGQLVPRLEYLMRKYHWTDADARDANARMERVAARDGLEYNLDGLLTGNTHDAHRLLVSITDDADLQGDVLERLYRAYFTEGRSIFTHDSLAALASDAGLPADRARQILDGTDGDALVRADGLDARTLGITGVPFFTIDGRFSISGAQPRTVFADAIARAWSDAHHDE